jgi:hypothetical protein
MKNRFVIERVVLVVAFMLVANSLSAESPLASATRPLDWSLGKWVGTRRDATTDQTVKLQLRVEAILGGIGQIEHLEAEHRQGAYLGFTVRMPTEKPGKWSMTYWNSKRTDSAQLNGEVEATCSTWCSAAQNKLRQSRLFSEQMGADGWRRTMSVSDDQGKSWRVLWVDELRRSR